jgi:hypothetical protein
MTDPILEVYQRFAHLDEVISFMGANEDVTFRDQVLFELWQAIKAYAEEKRK